jgi:hypothetical protein
VARTLASVKYIAKIGLNFDGIKDKPRVEPGEPIPVVSDKEIKELLAIDAIEEVKEKKSKETK